MGKRKLLPALIELESQGWLPEDYRIVVTTRQANVSTMKEQLLKYVQADAEVVRQFSERIITVGNFDPALGGEPLAAALANLDYPRRLFYAATPPDQFAHIAAALAGCDLLRSDSPLVLEKPLGHDLAGYLAINTAVVRHVPEHLIYRIDHYLGKETVQNLLCLRFANLLFESVWNRAYIDHVQITVAETLGIASRAGYYDASGAIRDMVQNHLTQLLCLTAMEPPRAYDADCVRDEKLKVLQSLTPIAADDLVLGQYSDGLVNGAKVAAYRDDVSNSDSTTESFVALKVIINNWRWAGVPFYLRTGKRLPVRDSHIVIRFKSVPHMIFTDGGVPYNQIVIRLQPNEGVELLISNKLPGPGGLRLESKVLNLNFSEAGKALPDAYERLLLDALRGNPTLYMRHDEVAASWSWIASALDGKRNPVEHYNAGTWGPDSAQFLLARDNRRWVNPTSSG